MTHHVWLLLVCSCEMSCGHALYLIEKSLRKLLETLGAHEALFMVQLPVTVDNLLSRSEATLASLAGSTGQGISNAAGEGKNNDNNRSLV